MAIYHLSAKMISRSTRDTVSAVAYRSGTKLINRRTGESFDYSLKNVESVELILPADSPEWTIKLQHAIAQNKTLGVQHFVDVCEAAEKRKDAQVYREIEVALPKELTDEQGKELARQYIREVLCAEGPVCLANFHMDEDEEGGRKPHCHILMTTRSATESGLSEKKLVELNKKQYLEEWREKWADYVNMHLKQHGIDQQIDHRSYKDRGIDLVPQPKMSWGTRAVDRSGNLGRFDHMSRTIEEYGLAKLANQYKILRKPEIIFQVIQEKRATFGWGDVERTIAAHVMDVGLRERLSEDLKKSSDLLIMKGGREARNILYTTQTMRGKEQVLVETAQVLSEKDIYQGAVFNENSPSTLSDDQKRALKTMLLDKGLACIDGPAGSGKTTLIKESAALLRDKNIAVYGLAPTGKAAQNMEEGGVASETIHRFLKSFSAGRAHYAKGSVLLVDEAGMIDTHRMHDLLRAAQKLELKVVLIGDSQQLRAVGAGRPYDLIKDSISSEVQARLQTVRRQKIDWQREASTLFAADKADKAMQLYLERGQVRVGEEGLSNITVLMKENRAEEIVERFALADKVSRRIYMQMQEDVKSFEKDASDIKGHKDWEVYAMWRSEAKKVGSWIGKNYDYCLDEIKHSGIRSDRLEGFVIDEEKNTFKQRLEALEPLGRLKQPDMTREARALLVQDWKSSYVENKGESHLVLAATNKDVALLNHEIRQVAKGMGILADNDASLSVARSKDGTLGGAKYELEKKSFASGDRLLITRNDMGMGVKNGSLGTVTKIEGKTLSVHLDDGRDIRFSANLFPHFDHGWAITVHKSQGTTVDRSFVLASYGMDKHLTNVALTRHRKDVRLYASSLDFWDKSILLNRLTSQTQKDMALEKEFEQPQEDATTFLDKAVKKISREVGALKGLAKLTQNALRGYELEEAQKGAPLSFDENSTSVEKRQSNYQYLGVSPFVFREKILKVDKAGNEHMSEVSIGEAKNSKNERYGVAMGSYYDRDQVLSKVSSGDIELLADRLFGDRGKKTKHGSHELRYGRKGSASIQVSGPRQGMWFDFKTSEGGDIFHLVHSLGLADSYGEAIAYIGEKSGVVAKEITTAEIAKKKSNQAEQALDINKYNRSVAHAEKTFGVTKPVEGTLGEVYLREHRGYKGFIPEDIRFADYRLSGEEKYPTLLNFVRDNKGKLTGYQEIYLDKDTGNKAQGLEVGKRSRGLCKGASLQIQGGSNDVAFIAEGVETALSIKSAGIEGRIAAGLGRYIFKNLDLSEKNIVLVGDYDGPGAKTHELLEKEAESLREKGHTVHIVMPTREGLEKCDFNDILKEQGKEGIKESLYKELPQDLRLLCMKAYTHSQQPNLDLEERYNKEFDMTGMCREYLSASLLEDIRTEGLFDSNTSEAASNRAAEILEEQKDRTEANPTQYDKEIAIQRAAFEAERQEQIREDLQTKAIERGEKIIDAAVIEAQVKQLTYVEGQLYEKDLIARVEPQTSYEKQEQTVLAETQNKVDSLSASYQDNGMPQEQANLTATLVEMHEIKHGSSPNQSQIERYEELSKEVCEQCKTASSEEKYLVADEHVSRGRGDDANLSKSIQSVKEDLKQKQNHLQKEIEFSHDRGREL